MIAEIKAKFIFTLNLSAAPVGHLLTPLAAPGLLNGDGDQLNLVTNSLLVFAATICALEFIKFSDQKQLVSSIAL